MHEAPSQSVMLVSMKSSMDKMETMKISEDPDYDFAMMMIAHHQAAIDMSNVLIEKGTSLDLREKAKTIKLSQAAEINDMEAYLRTRTDIDGVNLSKEQTPEMKKNMDVMMKGMHAVRSKDIDHEYAEMMIPHHQAAIDMSEQFLQKGKSVEMKKLAAGIVDIQQQEIGFFKDWLQKH